MFDEEFSFYTVAPNDYIYMNPDVFMYRMWCICNLYKRYLSLYCVCCLLKKVNKYGTGKLWCSLQCSSVILPYNTIIHENALEISSLTHWGRVTHICVSKLTIIVSDNGLSSGRRQAIIWTNAGILLICPLGANFSEISIDIHTFSLKKIHFKMSSGKWRPFCHGLNVLKLSDAACINNLGHLCFR